MRDFYITICIYISVLAQQPTLTNWTLGNPEFFAGEEATLICRSSPTRPAVAVKWKKGTTALTDIRQSEIVNSDGLVTVLSKAVFHPQRSDNLVSVSCETSMIDQHPLKVQHAMTVWCKYSVCTGMHLILNVKVRSYFRYKIKGTSARIWATHTDVELNRAVLFFFVLVLATEHMQLM